MEQNVKISMLNQIYGKLLTQKQCEMIENYYNNDLSLSEIAQNNDITRQAVRDILKKGEKKLFAYEEKLKIMEKVLKQEKKIKQIVEQIEKIQNKETKEKVTMQTLEHIKKELASLDLN